VAAATAGSGSLAMVVGIIAARPPPDGQPAARTRGQLAGPVGIPTLDDGSAVRPKDRRLENR
jgi:hypothetical protein